VNMVACVRVLLCKPLRKTLCCATRWGGMGLAECGYERAVCRGERDSSLPVRSAHTIKTRQRAGVVWMLRLVFVSLCVKRCAKRCVLRRGGVGWGGRSHCCVGRRAASPPPPPPLPPQHASVMRAVNAAFASTHVAVRHGDDDGRRFVDGWPVRAQIGSRKQPWRSASCRRRSSW
jgi:hypothetical protein